MPLDKKVAVVYGGGPISGAVIDDQYLGARRRPAADAPQTGPEQIDAVVAGNDDRQLNGQGGAPGCRRPG